MSTIRGETKNRNDEYLMPYFSSDSNYNNDFNNIIITLLKINRKRTINN